MGEVWLARDLELNRRVAIKLLPPHVTNDAIASRFSSGSPRGSALNHPNVCTIHALGRCRRMAAVHRDGVHRRMHTAARLSRRPLPIREAVDMAVQMAAGLGAAHAAGVTPP
jgi:serine/threonine-protein kinase